MENAASVQLPRTCCHCNSLRSFGSQRSFKRLGIVGWILHISRTLHSCLVCLASLITALVGNVCFQCDTSAHGQVESQLHGRALASSCAAAMVWVLDAIH